MGTETTNSGDRDNRGPRAEVVTDAVVAAYIHEISDHHRPASATEQPAEQSNDD
jgi:hypothetical protein